MFSRVDQDRERTSQLPPVDGRRRVVIARVRPELDGGRFAVKRVLGDDLAVEVDLLVDGHDHLDGVVRYRAPGRAVREQPLVAAGNDRYRAAVTLDQLGRWYYTVEAWVDELATFCWALGRKLDAQEDVAIDLLVGAALVAAAAERAAPRSQADARELDAAARALGDVTQSPARRAQLALSEELRARVARHPDRRWSSIHPHSLAVVVDPPRARCSAWYELFPRSCGAPGVHGTFADAAARLPYVADLGFDTLYLPPIHPIGRTHRKGPNNTPEAEPNDVGSPWAIGAATGGHHAVHPRLGTLADFRRLVESARALGIEVALDVAFQCSPDHPYVREHPDWFVLRPDGSIQYAENPPKKYQDVYPFRFDGEAYSALWEELRSVILFWIEQGVTIFRVDNPHTKPLPFWEWCIETVKAAHPEAIFLAEAFTRPKLMHQLAKLGFTQSYTYFTWRTTKDELMAYLAELTEGEVPDYFRPNFWPNTPDILPEHLQYGGRAAFVQRLILAATLSSSYGIYGPPFELMEHRARPGSEEYLDNEKYQLRHWDLAEPDSLAPVIRLVNRARRDNRALQDNRGLRFHPTDNEHVIAYSKASGDNVVIVVVNLDPAHAHSAWVDLDPAPWGLGPGEPFQVHDLLGESRHRWHAGRNFVQLDPRVMPAHLFRLRRRTANERDFEYYL